MRRVIATQSTGTIYRLGDEISAERGKPKGRMIFRIYISYTSETASIFPTFSCGATQEQRRYKKEESNEKGRPTKTANPSSISPKARRTTPDAGSREKLISDGWRPWRSTAPLWGWWIAETSSSYCPPCPGSPSGTSCAVCLTGSSGWPHTRQEASGSDHTHCGTNSASGLTAS